MRYRTIAAAVAVTAAAAAGCSSPAHAPVTGTAAANQLVCQHYLKQRDWVKSLVQPTLADAQQLLLDLSADEAQSAGRLHADLAAMVRNENTKGNAYYAASVRVYRDCT